MEDMKKHLGQVDVAKVKLMVRVEEDYENGKLSFDEARSLLEERVGSCTPAEIALAEQMFTEEDPDQCRKEDIQGKLALFEGILQTGMEGLPADHPLSRYVQENEACKKITLEIEDLVQYPLIKNQWIELYDRLMQVKRHLSRKQMQLYPVLEQKGFTRPTTTMWTLDDYVRDEIRDAHALLDADDDDAFIERQQTIVTDLRDLMAKEESILFPTSLKMITPEEFEAMKSGDAEIGYAWLDLDVDHRALEREQKAASSPDATFVDELAALLGKHGIAAGPDAELDMKTGKLTLSQVNLMLQNLPLDISFVDEHEIVKFYSDTDHRIFPRSKNVIGRDVKNCHPRASVHIVQEIVEKFRAGEEDEVDFWINKPGAFIYIYYKAVRDEDGTFRGVLEMMQDCTRIRSLEDSRTLLTWGSEK